MDKEVLGIVLGIVLAVILFFTIAIGTSSNFTNKSFNDVDEISINKDYFDLKASINRNKT